MKKTITINLAGIVFHIDEDAYKLLNEYLENLRIYFSAYEGSEEIIEDIEGRFSELLSERITKNNQSVILSDIEKIIHQIGQPEDIFGEEESIKLDPNEKTTAKKENKDNSKSYIYRKKLYRNPDDKIIGGVASGLAAFFKIDSLIIRLIFIALLFITFGSTTLIYLILWLLVPQANSAIEKLNMAGEDVTVESIGKKMSSDFDESSEVLSNSSGSGYRFLNGCVKVLGYLFKGIFILIGIALAPLWIVLVFILLILVIAFVISLFVGGAAFIGVLGQPFVLMLEATPFISAFSGLVLAGIPLVCIVYFIVKKIFHLPDMSNLLKWILFVVWVIAVIIFVVSLPQIQWDMYRNIETSLAQILMV